MLLSIFFNDGTTVAEVEALVHSYPFESLRGFASVDKDAPDGTRLTFAEDGGARFVAVPDDNDAALISCLDIWRVAEGMGDIAPVIREKQLCRKMVDHIIQNDGGRLYKRHYKRPFGSGEGMAVINEFKCVALKLLRRVERFIADDKTQPFQPLVHAARRTFGRYFLLVFEIPIQIRC